MDKDMKIRVNDTNRQEVKEALLGMGYTLCTDSYVRHKYDTASAFVVRKGLDTLCRIDDDDEVNYFEECSATEHWFVNGKFVDALYWTQPKTVHSQQSDFKQKLEEVLEQCTKEVDEELEQWRQRRAQALQDFLTKHAEVKTPFQSRTVHNKARMLALAEQISHLLHTKQEVPVEYALELYELTEDVAEELKYAEMGGYF